PPPALCRGPSPSTRFPYTTRFRSLAFLKIAETAQHIAERVTQFAVAVGDTFQDFVTNAVILGKVDAGRPQTQNIRAIDVDNLLRIKRIAERFRHFLARLVERHAVG